MSQIVEQLKQRAAELRRRPRLTTEHIDALNETAWEFRNLNSTITAELSREALQFAVRCDYARGRAFALRAAGWCELRGEQYQRAAQTLSESRATFAALRSPENSGLASTINVLALAQRYLGDHETALASCSSALELCRESGEQAQAALIYHGMASIHFRLSDYTTALEYFYQASPIFAALRMSQSQARLFIGLGELLLRVGEAEMSMEHSEQAIACLQEHQDRYNEAVGWVNLGAAQHSRQQYQKALHSYSRALNVSQGANSLAVQAEAQRSIGSLHLEQGDLAAALACFEPALALARGINNFYEESETLLQLGAAYEQLGDETSSLQALEQAFAISQQYGYNEVRTKAHLALSRVFEKQGKLTAALAHHQAYYHLSQTIFGVTTARQIERLLFENQASNSNSAVQNAAAQQHLTRHRHSAAALARSSSALQRSRVALPPHKLQQISRFINEHLDQNITLAMLADVVQLNRDHFIRSFKQTTAKTPHQFVLEQRIERAKQLLRTTKLPLAEIALHCGFNSQSHLTTQFRLSTGITPHHYRQSA